MEAESLILKKNSTEFQFRILKQEFNWIWVSLIEKEINLDFSFK